MALAYISIALTSKIVNRKFPFLQFIHLSQAHHFIAVQHFCDIHSAPLELILSLT